MREAKMRQTDGREQQELECPLDCLRVGVPGGAPRRAAAVVDEDVDAAERIGRSSVRPG